MSTAILEQQPVETVPEKETEPTTTWKYLAPRPESWKKQLFLTDSRMTAANLYFAMLASNQTAEEAAADRDLPLEAVLEAIRYCEANEALLNKEAEEQERIIDEMIEISRTRRNHETAD